MANRDKIIARVKAWGAANAERRNETLRKWRARNPERVSAWHKQDRRTNPTKYQVQQQNRRAVKRGAPGDGITLKEWLVILANYKYRCVYCGVKAKSLSKDHVMPLSRGGRHEAANIVPACKSCNSKKHDALPEEWNKRIGRLL